MEMINMKIELAKQTSINECLTEEIQNLKAAHQKEISVLQNTIDMQQNIIAQLNERDILKSTCSEMSHDELELSFDGFEIIRSEAEEKNEELVRLIAKTTLELDEVKIRFEETKMNLENEIKIMGEKLNNEIKDHANTMANMGAVNDELKSINDDLSRDILHLKVEHEMNLYKCDQIIAVLQKKCKKLKNSLALKDCELKTSKTNAEHTKIELQTCKADLEKILLQEYEVIC